MVPDSHDTLRPDIPRRADYEPTWPGEWFIVPLLRELITAGVNEHAAPAPIGGRALDVGCGRQPFRHLLEGVGYAYTGFDVGQNPERTVDVLGVIDGPLPAELLARGPFQFLLCTEVLEHVADWRRAFENFTSLLAPGARLLVTCPHFYNLHEEPHDFWRATPYTLKRYGEDAGLRVLEQRAAGDAIDVLGTALAQVFPVARSRRLPDKIMRRFVAEVQKVILRVMRRKWRFGPVRLDTKLYLANYAVFEKSGTSAGH